MSEHTKGPWEWLGKPGCSILNSAHGEVLGYAAYEGLWPGRFDKVEDAANMRLIAAAPDLLGACKMVAEMAVGWQPLTPGDIAEVRAAIAKAEGKP
jgi:hypothetical protein